jgi:hypothetical protein
MAFIAEMVGALGSLLVFISNLKNQSLLLPKFLHTKCCFPNHADEQ